MLDNTYIIHLDEPTHFSSRLTHLLKKQLITRSIQFILQNNRCHCPHNSKLSPPPPILQSQTPTNLFPKQPAFTYQLLTYAAPAGVNVAAHAIRSTCAAAARIRRVVNHNDLRARGRKLLKSRAWRANKSVGRRSAPINHRRAAGGDGFHRCDRGGKER